ncbi:MAG: glucokinase [Gammaproteobacteria bacterium]
MSFDIGGTHIRGRISSDTNGELQVLASVNATFDDFADTRIEEVHPIEMVARLIKEFEAKTDRDASEIRHATLAVAGKVDHRRKSAHVVANMTEISADDAKEILLENGCKADVHIVNDFEAAAFGAAAINDSTRKLIRGATRPRAIEKNLKKILICGPGTGLGVACLVLDLYKAGQHFVMTSEAGHTTFGPETPAQHEFLDSETGRRMSYENVVSGPGLVRLYQWNRRRKATGPGELYITPKEICNLAVSGESVALEAVDMFSHALGAFCGNQVLAFNCDRYVYLWGGVLNGIPDNLLLRPFSMAYGQRLKYPDAIAAVPVYRVTDSNMAHKGCIVFSKIMLGEQGQED